MKYFIVSDIHGSALWCRRAVQAFEKEQADKMIILGDILYHGPRNDLPDEYAPKRVIELLNPLKQKLLCVRGNCDSEVDQMVLEFPILAEYAFIENGGRQIFLMHGHKLDTLLSVCPEGSVVLSGHTHVPKIAHENGILCLNPGSASIPKEGSHHGYMLLEDGRFIWKDFDGNVIREYSEN